MKSSVRKEYISASAVKARLKALDENRLIDRLKRLCGWWRSSDIDGAVDEMESGDHGWRIATYDPNRLLACCKYIWLKKGFKLASYDFGDDEDGNGFTLVIPKHKTLPDPAGQDIAMGWDMDKPVFQISGETAPDWLRSDIEAFLEGDHSPRSYFEASMFIRKIHEVGARGHGFSWVDHKVLTSPVINDGTDWKWDQQGPIDWKWCQQEPTDWRPLVTYKADGQTEVTFYTFTNVGLERLVRHTDTYIDGYRMTTAEATIAEGGPGIIY